MQHHKTRRAHTSDTDFLLRHDVHTDFIKPSSYKYQQLYCSLRGVKQPKREADYTLQSRHIKRGALIPQFQAISLRFVFRHKKNLHLVHTRETGWKIFSLTGPPKRKTIGARSRVIRLSRTIRFQGYHVISNILKTAIPLEMCRTNLKILSTFHGFKN
jgi:hypothetical protein